MNSSSMFNFAVSIIRFESDYHSAKDAGMLAFLLRREGSEGEGAHRDENEDLMTESIRTVSSLSEVADYVLKT